MYAESRSALAQTSTYQVQACFEVYVGLQVSMPQEKSKGAAKPGALSKVRAFLRRMAAGPDLHRHEAESAAAPNGESFGPTSAPVAGGWRSIKGMHMIIMACCSQCWPGAKTLRAHAPCMFPTAALIACALQDESPLQPCLSKASTGERSFNSQRSCRFSEPPKECVAVVHSFLYHPRIAVKRFEAAG